MKKAILGRKISMSQLFLENGTLLPVTVIEAGPCTVVQLKTKQNDGYEAIKIGFGDVKEKSLNKPDKGQFDKSEITPSKYLKELRLDDCNGFKIGQSINISDMFELGDKVDISGISKGKGFQGAIKRWGQSCGPMSHGSKYHRRVGSMGANSSPGKVFKGKRLPGHMGVDQITVQNLQVVKIYEDKNLILVKGAVPGPKNGLLFIKSTVKSGK